MLHRALQLGHDRGVAYNELKLLDKAYRIFHEYL